MANNYAAMCFAAKGKIKTLPTNCRAEKCDTWTERELAGMLDGDKGWFHKTGGQWYPRHEEEATSEVQPFGTLAEALLFAVMFEKGWLWTGAEFRRVCEIRKWSTRKLPARPGEEE